MEEQADAAGREAVMVVEEKPDEEEDDQMVEKVMRWLEGGISGAAATMPVVERCEAAESCGPTFSDSASTVMGIVGTRGLAEVAPYFWLPTYSARGNGGAAAREEPIEAAATAAEEE